jgi:hypothetical protein
MRVRSTGKLPRMARANLGLNDELLKLQASKVETSDKIGVQQIETLQHAVDIVEQVSAIQAEHVVSGGQCSRLQQ